MKAAYGILFALAAVSVQAQDRVTDRRNAEIRGGGGEGKCTLEVVVDDTAEVEISGPSATIRTLRGSPATFRRFQCNQPMPDRPYDFRFQGVDGRGRQELVRPAADGRPAVIRIQDSQGGSEGYTFDIFWRGNGGGPGGAYDRPGRGYDRPPDGGDGRGPGWNDGWGSGAGWVTGGNFNFEGGRPGSGSYLDRNGRRRRLDAAKVFIANSGQITVIFQTERGELQFNGRVDRRSNRLVFATVSGGGMNGHMQIEMSAYNRVKNISLSDIGLNWAN